MANARESPRRPTSAQTDSHLQYPTLPPLSASVEQWLSHSRPANNMTSDNLSDPPSKALSESWATLSVSDLHSEDGSRSEQTDIASLIDQATSDDVASLDGQDSNSDIDNPEQYHPRTYYDGDHGEMYALATSEHFPSQFSHAESAIADSNLTTRPSFRQSLSPIEFQEPEQWPEMEKVELKHTIHIFDEQTASEILGRIPHSPTHSILLATVQQTMTKQNIDLDKPFRVLYLGDSKYRNNVLDKIGDVLVSSSAAESQSSSAESSRYHVVPTSFGIGAVPNFAELLPIHVQLVVDECTEASSDVDGDRPSILRLDFKNRPACRSRWLENKFQVSSTSEWTLPDVAIVFVSSHDNATAVRTRNLAHVFLERHGIPAMVISDDPIWKQAGETTPLNKHSLHTCLESRHPENGETNILKRYPIDLETFESITPSQLNRNLASLTDIYPKKTLKSIPEHPRPAEQSFFADSRKFSCSWIPSEYTNWTRGLVPIFSLVILMLVLAVALPIGSSALKAIYVFFTQFFAGSALSLSFSQASTTSAPTASFALDGSRQTSLSIRPLGNLNVGNIPVSDVTAPEKSSFFFMAISSAPTDPDGFEIQVVGDCHMVIKPPRSFSTSRKQRRFNVSVYRNDRSLPHELTRLFDGVYTLRLDREDAYGLVDVTITVKSKPPINQTMTIDFGIPWLKVANWRRAAQNLSSQITKDLQIAQTELSEVYGRLTTDLQVIMGDVVKRSHFLWEDAELLRRESIRAGDKVLSRSKQISKVITSNTLQRFQTMSSILQGHSVTVNRGAKGIVDDAWNRLGKSTANLDLYRTLEGVRSVKSALGRAQTRARHFVGLQQKKMK